MSEIEELKKRIEALEAAVKWLQNPTFGGTGTVTVGTTLIPVQVAPGTCTPGGITYYTVG
jgi:hypothetical protein